MKARDGSIKLVSCLFYKKSEGGSNRGDRLKTSRPEGVLCLLAGLA
ncbi:hypothetical protein [Neobacillus notoginsengisoli]|nr:hypothetical protein [Neobacillus notoginsengisoli]